jgi:hypothetical protein
VFRVNSHGLNDSDWVHRTRYPGVANHSLSRPLTLGTLAIPHDSIRGSFREVSRSKRVIHSILAAFAAANTTAEYNRAKRRVEKLDVVSKLALIDAMIDAHNRISGKRVGL